MKALPHSGTLVWDKSGVDLCHQRNIRLKGNADLHDKVRVDEGKFIPERPVRWEGGTASPLAYSTIYDLHPDGERLLVRKLAEEETVQIPDHLVLFGNFFDYVREQLSTSEN
ncbi:MAG: hypothetical protein IIC50_24390 [Planctomycetes bacterium]|nr:hypothetical protein [Planctomycetota bacterium]